MLLTPLLFAALTFAQDSSGPTDVETSPPAFEQPDEELWRPKFWFGYESAWLDDVDGDGWHDLAVPASGYSRDERPLETMGVVLVVSGKTGDWLHTLEPRTGETRFGRGVAGTGDLDGNGSGEVLVYGALPGDGSAYLRAVSPDGGEVFWEARDMPQIGYFGGLVGGDLDGDGWSDALIFGSSGWRSPGRAVVISGCDGSRLLDVGGPAGGFGGVVGGCFVGDWDADGVGDVALGTSVRLAQEVDGEGADQWLDCVDVVSGATGKRLARVKHPKEGLFGFTLAAGDVDGDGLDELFVGATDFYDEHLQREQDWADGIGCAYVFRGGDAEPMGRHSLPSLWQSPSLDPYPGQLEFCAPQQGASDPDSRGLLLISNEGAFREDLHGLSLDSGRAVWSVRPYDNFPSLMVRHAYHFGSWLSDLAPPDAEGRRSIAVGTANHVTGGNDWLCALDPATGAVRWAKDGASLLKEAGLFVYPGFPGPYEE